MSLRHFPAFGLIRLRLSQKQPLREVVLRPTPLFQYHSCYDSRFSKEPLSEELRQSLAELGRMAKIEPLNVQVRSRVLPARRSMLNPRQRARTPMEISQHDGSREHAGIQFHFPRLRSYGQRRVSWTRIVSNLVLEKGINLQIDPLTKCQRPLSHDRPTPVLQISRICLDAAAFVFDKEVLVFAPPQPLCSIVRGFDACIMSR